MNKFLLIGFGNMGKAFYKGMLMTLSKEDIFVCDKTEDKMKEVRSEMRTSDINLFINKVDTIIFAVKPQSFSETVGKISADLSNKNIISMMAGKPFAELQKKTKSKNITRIMPNLSVEFGNGITLWISNGKKINLKQILGNMGIEVEMGTEDQFNSLTPITGSGQAFYFLLSEIFVNKAISLGINKEKANKLVRMVLKGCNDMASYKGEDFEGLREKITSKGGMTETSINYLKGCGLENIIGKALDKGAARGQKID